MRHLAIPLPPPAAAARWRQPATAKLCRGDGDGGDAVGPYRGDDQRRPEPHAVPDAARGRSEPSVVLPGPAAGLRAQVAVDEELLPLPSGRARLPGKSAAAELSWQRLARESGCCCDGPLSEAAAAPCPAHPSAHPAAGAVCGGARLLPAPHLGQAHPMPGRRGQALPATGGAGAGRGGGRPGAGPAGC